MDHAAIGSQLRSRRAAAGRTVASVAADAGLSVPYIANLENGRGNPTITALARLAEALGMRLAVTLVPDGGSSLAFPPPQQPQPRCPHRWSGSAAPPGSGKPSGSSPRRSTWSQGSCRAGW